MVIYHKFVEIGRVVYIAKGTQQGKLAVIVNVIDGNKVCFEWIVCFDWNTQKKPFDHIQQKFQKSNTRGVYL